MEATSALATDYMTRCLARPRLNRAAAVSCPHTPRRANGQGQRTPMEPARPVRPAQLGRVLSRQFSAPTRSPRAAGRGPRAAVHRCAQDEPQKPGSNLRWLLLSSGRGSLAHLGLQGILDPGRLWWRAAAQLPLHGIGAAATKAPGAGQGHDHHGAARQRETSRIRSDHALRVHRLPAFRAKSSRGRGDDRNRHPVVLRSRAARTSRSVWR
jgi:hypothetical protein